MSTLTRSLHFLNAVFTMTILASICFSGRHWSEYVNCQILDDVLYRLHACLKYWRQTSIFSLTDENCWMRMLLCRSSAFHQVLSCYWRCVGLHTAYTLLFEDACNSANSCYIMVAHIFLMCNISYRNWGRYCLYATDIKLSVISVCWTKNNKLICMLIMTRKFITHLWSWYCCDIEIPALNVMSSLIYFK